MIYFRGVQQLDFLPAPGGDQRARLARRVAAWAARGVYFGGSSWKYPGWLGQIYTHSRYTVRGRFAQTRFDRDCLSEYAEVFPTVCGDFAFYRFYPQAFWDKLFHQVPATFRFGFKAPEQITSPADGNPDFLNAGLVADQFLDRLAPHRAQVGYIVFEFPQFHQPRLNFPAELDRFLAALPAGLRYGVELRTRSLLESEYFDVLRRHRVAHVFNSWTHMPVIGEQLALPDSLTADFTIVRALLRPGRSYEQAVRLLQPYSELRDPWPAGFHDVAQVVRRARGETFIAVNNRFTGNAPLAIGAILDELESA